MSKIVLSPFSNSDIRDWPPGHYVELIDLLLKHDRCQDYAIDVIGVQGQRLHACEIVRSFPTDRVVNACGRLSWNEVLHLVRTAEGMVGNNSGLTHVAASFGIPTVCVFGGSHQRLEWRPRGANVAVLSRAIGCSPCQLDHGSVSPYNKACLREITPAQVLDALLMVIRQADRGATGD